MDIAGIWAPLLGGLVLLIGGGEMLVRGAVGLAARLSVSPLVIGVTVVGIGTSTPELVTSVQAGLIGSPGIAYGNIVGSNIANILLILGVSALLWPMAVDRATLRRDGAAMAAGTMVFALAAVLLPMPRWSGVILVALLAAYLIWTIRSGTAGGALVEAPQEDPAPVWRVAALTLAGLVLVVAGGAFLVDGAVTLAQGLGVSEAVIGLTIVAVGTSLPELVTSVMAALRRQADVALGNILGSNLFNLLGIGGVTAMMAPGAVPAEIVLRDLPVMLAATALILVLAWIGARLSRADGAVLLAGYAGFLALTVMAGT